MPAPNTEADFWERVDVGEPDECWLWIGYSGNKYPVFMMNGYQTQAHRWAYFFLNGEFPEPCGCHSCDTKACCNPSHIWPGTQTDNMKDMWSKGRARPGKGAAISRANSRRRLSEETRAKIGKAQKQYWDDVRSGRRERCSL